MNFFILVLVVCFFIFLYTVYLLSNDDFVILRRDIPMERIFNIVFLTALVSLFFSRLFYVIFHPNNIFGSLLGFLLFPYFPGLSLSGGILGGVLFSVFYFKINNLPLGRLFDFFSIGFLVSYPLGFVGFLVLSKAEFSNVIIVSLVLIFLLSLCFIKYVLPATLGGKLKDGTLGLLFLLSFSIISILINVLNKQSLRSDELGGIKSIFDKENILFFVIFISALIFLIKQEWKERLRSRQ